MFPFAKVKAIIFGQKSDKKREATCFNKQLASVKNNIRRNNQECHLLSSYRLSHVYEQHRPNNDGGNRPLEEYQFAA
jgi:hypothetical protein